MVQKAVKKLRELSKEKPKTVKQWLSRQAFWQVHLPAPKCIDRRHYQVTIPNEMHQFDLLYMPSDSLYGSKYKYILAGIDAASRFFLIFFSIDNKKSIQRLILHKIGMIAVNMRYITAIDP